MLIQQKQIKKCLTPKLAKPRSVGIRQVSCRNNRSMQFFLKQSPQLLEQKSIKTQDHNYSVQKSQEVIHLGHRSIDHEITSRILEKCLKPQIIQLNENITPISDQNSVQLTPMQILTQNDSNRQSSSSKPNIRLGSKGQKHRQNNKSEPKKVFSVRQLSQNQKESVKQQKQSLKKNIQTNNSEIVNDVKKTERKNSPNIFLCTKKSPHLSQFQNKLRRFQEDMKKTRKPKILKLNINLSKQVPSQNQIQVENKDYIGLKNHQITPKVQPFFYNDLKIFPSVDSQYRWIGTKNQALTVIKNHVPVPLAHRRDQMTALQKTKKILNYSIHNSTSQNLVTRVIETPHVESGNEEQSIKILEPKIEHKSFQRLSNLMHGSTISKQVESTKNNLIKQGEEAYSPRFHCVSPLLNIKTDKLQNRVEPFSFKQILSSDNANASINTLRTTDNPKYQSRDSQTSVQSPSLSERQKTNFETNQKPFNNNKNKLFRLNDGAKTIVTKYDSSEKRSIVEQSIILFQCSKDLKPSFSRQLFDDYAAKYRGSLGVEMLINQSEEQEAIINERQRVNQIGYNYDFEQNPFENIAATPKTSKLRKSYSIKQNQSATVQF